jgi:predicted N-acyltransferase
LSDRRPADPGSAPFEVRLVQGIEKIDAAAWDRCVGADQPFLRHGFLRALEDSGSATAETGWLPVHLAVEDRTGLVACAPMYLKSHSYGEYVFDWGWASAFERAGGQYYPKLQVAVPFTPVPGPRLLARPDVTLSKEALIQGLTAAARQIECSSLHITFCEQQEWQALGDAGMMRRQGLQFHWHNRGYKSFDDFLAVLKSSKRKMIKKERARVRAQGLTLETLTGDRITPAIWDAFYPFYLATTDKRWGSAYLTKRFFQTIGELMPEQIVLVMAKYGGRYVAGALNLLGGDTLYGRNWGCRQEFDFLHFEACYYAAIDFAIERGLARVEAGAQGKHKIQRGYEPVPTYSAHWIRDRSLAAAVERFLQHERIDTAMEQEELNELLPYRETS